MERSGWKRAGVLVAVALAVSACGKKPAPVTPAPEPSAAPRAPSSTVDRDAEERARREAEERARREAEERSRAALEAPVHFDYDSSDIRSEDRALLEAKVPVLRADPAVRLRIEGHADERGSIEYNLALGMRRAESAKLYLTNFGIEAARLETVSFGEDRPADPGQTERAWAKNRRAEFRPSGGRITSN